MNLPFPSTTCETCGTRWDSEELAAACDHRYARFWAQPKPLVIGVEPAPEPTIKEQIADEAKRIVSGVRRSAYGKPEDNFERIARFWTAYFMNTNRDITVLAEDVSLMMALMKIARIAETPDHCDSWVDLVGYALTGAEVNKVKFPG